MRLRAVTTGAGVPPSDFGGRVREIFRRALLIDTDEAGLLTITASEAGGLPAAIGVDLPAEAVFPSIVAAGIEAAARGGVLRFAGSGLAIDLAGAVPWRSNLARLGLDLARPASRVAADRAAAMLAAHGGATALVALAGSMIAALISATRDGDAGAATEAAGRLVGLGAGGTPAGDDFLVGFLAALHAAGSASAGPLGATVVAASARTNDISAIYLRAAAAGEVSERLADLAGAVAEGGDVATAMTLALAVGHTSGADGVLGLLAGVSAIAPAPLGHLF